MSGDTSAFFQLTRHHRHLSVQYDSGGDVLAHLLRASAGRPLLPQVEHFLLRQMDRMGSAHHHGVFYAGGIHHPLLFLFAASSASIVCVGQSCTPVQAEQRFQPCDFPDCNASEAYTAVLLRHTGGAYCPDASHVLPADVRHLLRRCFRLEGPDFPDVCFRWNTPVQWLQFSVQAGLPQCYKLHLIPLCAARRQVLLLQRPVSPEEMLCSLCHIPDSNAPVLTPREQQTLELARQGLPNRAIAAILQIQEGTVKKLLSAVYAKLGIHSRYDLLRLNRG